MFSLSQIRASRRIAMLENGESKLTYRYNPPVHPGLFTLQSPRMKVLWLMLIASLPVQSAVIDASASTSVVLQPGDSLAFQIFTWNFGFNAARYGLDRN